MRLIDADDLLKKKREMELCFAVPEWEIEKAPTIDAVPVVRCKDCANGELCLNSQGSEYVVCVMDEHHVWLPNGFCCYGERKDGEG